MVDIADRIYGNGYEGNDLLEFNFTKYTYYIFINKSLMMKDIGVVALTYFFKWTSRKVISLSFNNFIYKRTFTLSILKRIAIGHKVYSLYIRHYRECI
jgi:hypothetical protein